MIRLFHAPNDIKRYEYILTLSQSTELGGVEFYPFDLDTQLFDGKLFVFIDRMYFPNEGYHHCSGRNLNAKTEKHFILVDLIKHYIKALEASVGILHYPSLLVSKKEELITELLIKLGPL